MSSVLIYKITLIVICICFSAFFSVAEAALSSLSDLKARRVIDELGDRAKSLDLWVSNPNRVLYTITAGKIFVNILASVMAANVAELLLNIQSIALVTGVMTFTILFFGEVIPKAFSVDSGMLFSVRIMSMLKVFYFILLPVTFLLDKTACLFAKIGGVKDNRLPKITEDELEFLINVGEKEGILEKNKGEMLTNIFDISDSSVREVMVPRIDIIAVPDSVTKEKLWALIKETEFSRIPVYKESLDDIIGILYVKDLLKMDRLDYDIKDVMKLLREPIFVPETKKIDVMLKDFQKSRLHMAVVMDEYGGTAGIVTMEDILEEIVGDIFDEYDEEDTEIAKIGDGHYLIDAGMNIDDFCEEFNFEKTDDMEDYETLGGFILDVAGEIPKIGYSFEWKHYIFTVKKMKDKRLERIEIRKIPAAKLEETANEQQ